MGSRPADPLRDALFEAKELSNPDDSAFLLGPSRRKELLHSLMRQPQEIRGISNRQTEPVRQFRGH